MLGPQITLRRGARDEAERPFWISFADLMTALMVLFLVVMGVALLAVTKTVTEKEKAAETRREEIERWLNQFGEIAKQHEGIRIDRERRVVDFGNRARFAWGRHDLNTQQEEVLRQFVPEILSLANSDLGRKVLKRIVVEGFTDKTGTYLSNLNLSLLRSQRVLCALFASNGSYILSREHKESVRDMFLVGGYSSNAAKETDEESRRVEMRLEFLGVGEQRPSSSFGSNFGDCALR